MPHPAAVIIGNHTQALGIVRSAAAARGDVWVVNDRSGSLTRFSKHLTGYRQIVRGALRRLDQVEGADTLLEALLALPVERPSLLFGVNEDIVSFIHRHQRLLQHKYFIPAVRFDRIYDKYQFNSLLPESVQIDTRLYSDTDIRTATPPDRFILKGRQGNAFRRLTGEKAKRLDQVTQDELDGVLARLSVDQVIVQEIIKTDRPVTSVCSFSVNGRIQGTFAYEKLRQHPKDFGTGTYLRSVRASLLEPLAAQVLQTLDFTGISEIEFIYDCQTGTYKVIEMNPRTWKSIHFATQCGQNLVASYLTYLSTGQAMRGDEYSCGRYWVDLATDIPQMIRERKWPRYQRGVLECTWDKSDPWPAVALWTLFPLIGLENGLSSLAGAARDSC